MSDKQLKKLKDIMADKHRKGSLSIGDLWGHIEMLLKKVDEYNQYLSRPPCYECGYRMTAVRPGKYQCDWCDMQHELQNLRSDVKKSMMYREEAVRYHDVVQAAINTLSENSHLADGDNCSLKELRDAVEALPEHLWRDKWTKS